MTAPAMELRDTPEAPNADTPPAIAPSPEEGALLAETDEAKVCRKIEYWWAVDEKRQAVRDARARRTKYWRAGIRDVYLTTDDAGGNPNVWAPQTSALLPPVPNHCDRLARRVTAQLLADPPLPDVIPSTGDEQHESQAEFATRVLRVEGSEAGQNWRRKAEIASDIAHTFGSAFAYCTVDPTGGGWEPMDIQAHPNAVDATVPLDDPEPPTVPAMDPMTGQPAVDPSTGMPAQQPNPKFKGASAPLVRKYVMPDGSLSDKPAGASKRWLPKDKWCILPAPNVRFVPHTTVLGLEEADGVVLCRPTTLGELKRAFPETVGAYGEEALLALAAYRPPKLEELRKLNALGGDTQDKSKQTNEDGVLEDDTACYPLVCYFRSHFAYPKGAYLVVAGGKVLHKQAWAETRDDGVEECLEIPLSQCRDLDTAAEAEPMGMGLCESLGPLDEIHAKVWTFLLEYMYKHGNPNVFSMAMSPVQPEQLRRRDGTPIEVMSKEDVPIYEQVPQLPKEVTDMKLSIVAELNSESGLEQAAQGVAAPSVNSGVHAEQIIEQALVALGSMKRNLDDFCVRMWRIALQVRRCYWTTPQRLRYESEDGAWREKEWRNTDLASTKDVRVARGSSTMMTQSAKAAKAANELTLKAITIDEYKELTSSGVDATFGRGDNSAKQRVMRQIVAFKDGPSTPEMAGQEAMALWAPLPTDEEQGAANIRRLHLGKLIDSTAFLKHSQSPEWQQALLQAYVMARQQSGMATVAEQQLAAQQAAEQQQQGRMAEIAAKGQRPAEQEAAEGQAAANEMRNMSIAA